MNKPSRELGFTLLEILIALAVFAVMSMMAYSGLSAILKAKESTKPRAAQMAQLQTTWYFFNDDLEQMVDRPIRDELGSTEPAFGIGRGNEVLVFTRRVPAWKSRTTKNTLQRVSYRFEDSALYRYSWTLLDRTPETQARRKLLINTNSVDIRTYDESSQSWLPFTGINGSIPKALDISLSLPQLGMIRRSFLVHQ
jgi:general secretion pathway protein J